MIASQKKTEFPMGLLWFLYQFLVGSFNRAVVEVQNHGFFFKNPSIKSSSHQYPLYPSVTKCNPHGRKSQTLVCDIHGCLLRSQSFFPYFMLVAFEGGSIFRAVLLLVSSPLLWILDYELTMRMMIFITFCGLKLKDMDSVSRAVLPKFYLENLNLHAYEVLESVGSRSVFTSVPRVMVEGFLKEYLSVDTVVGSELQTCGKYFTGLVSTSGLLVKHRAIKECFGEQRPDIGIGRTTLHDQMFISLCKEAYVVTREDIQKTSSIMPRNRYPKPLIFHDGRLAFLPTPFATLAMFLWLPIGIPLSIFRILIGVILPYKLAYNIGVGTGVTIAVEGNVPKLSENGKGVLYVCTHRTLLDPVMLCLGLAQPLTAVTYSLSKMSEILAPIRTVRLTRDRKIDGEMMHELLSDGDLVICPEGTTCREPYLLRFSSLFAELTDDIVPVAMNTSVTMFYGTTASGLKCLDSIFFMMNPKPIYTVRILEKLPEEITCGSGGKSAHDVANHIQQQLGNALGFECTNLTRRDKYLMLAGNEGIVKEEKK